MIRPELLAFASIVLPISALGALLLIDLLHVGGQVAIVLIAIFVAGPVIVGFIVSFMAFYLMSPDNYGAPLPRWANVCAILGLLLNGVLVFLAVGASQLGH